MLTQIQVRRFAHESGIKDLQVVEKENNLENLKAPDDTWKVRLIEEDLHRLMFDTEGA